MEQKEPDVSVVKVITLSLLSWTCSTHDKRFDISIYKVGTIILSEKGWLVAGSCS